MIITSKEVEKGDIVYLIGGQEAEYIMKAGEGHLVYPIFQDNNEETFLDDEKYVREIFSNPPIEKICKLVKEKSDELNAISVELTEARKQKSETEKIKKEYLSNLEHVDGLKRINDYLFGKITHYVVVSGYGLDNVEILDIKNAVYKESSWTSEPRLLCLYGSKKGKIEWKLNYYSDGSGESELAYPCCSFEEAKKLAEKIINEKTNESIQVKHIGHLENIIKSAQKIGLEVSKDAIRMVVENKINISKQAIDRLTLELDKAVKERIELEKSLSNI